MKKSIYKLTNKVNGKVYIGQSNNPQRRLQEHIRGDDQNSIIYLAIKKYGIKNFDFEIIEDNILNYNEREKYWIKFYQSQNKEMGYNRTEGGEEPPVIKGEDSPLSKIDNKTFSLLEKDIIDNKLSFIEISKKYKISEDYVSHINRGLVRRNKELTYPLRKSKNLINEDIYNLIRQDLIFTHLPTEHIAKKYNVDSSTVYRINKGETHKLKNLSYPIRNNYSKYSNWLLDHIYQEIKNNKYRFCDIEKMYKLSKSTLNRINQGKIHSRPNENYPLRDSSKRVRQPVSTISGETESSSTIDT